jgi:intein/homing endonuclease
MSIRDKEYMCKRKYNVDDSYFDNLDSEGSSYWLGVLSADGYIQSSRNLVDLTVKESDEEWLKSFKLSLSSNYPIAYSEKMKCVRFIFRSSHIVNKLNTYGVTQCKSLTLKFCEQVPKYNIRHYIRGLIDGDGSIWKSGESYNISLTGTPDVLKKVNQHLNLFTTGLSQAVRTENAVRKDFGDRKSYSVSWGGRENARNILRYLYGNATYYLPRKKSLANIAMALPEIGQKLYKCKDLTEENLKEMYQKYGNWALVADKIGIHITNLSNYRKKLTALKEPPLLKSRGADQG